ncbi:DUF2889 domain-containing protein [Paraburkholderia madseniana]|uniref:DUF2889 domain-containing protein n=1 Tax=Paraburkholderia madseniana TaxID=2599607 RepID=A0A6N6WKY3_9BURK|nr:DUF2889 domain-containing protein [Paraburkholderia madseniana]KAE8760060.1 DUF2889 domain-containing protein [Paraburkholderia madseniana]
MFRRRIVISSHIGTSQRVTRAALEDDFHHFRVEVASAHGQATRIDAASPRRPYTLCAQAAGQLQALVGMTLTQTAHEVTRVADASEQCTHLFELSGLAIAAAARGTLRRQYDVEVPTRVDDRTHPALARDGIPLLEWKVVGTVIQGPPPYAGIDLYHGMARWALTTLPGEEAEAALILRRATGIAKGRGMNLDEQVHARPNGNCFAQQPVRAEQAIRIVGSTLDFATRPAALCADDLAWLAFAE